MKKERKCHLCEAVVPAGNRDSLADLGWSGVNIRAPVRAMLYFCPKHTAKEISASVDAIIQPKCTKTECEDNPWMCKLPMERMNEECLRDIDDDITREKHEEDLPDPDDCCPC